jgi:hypothetical protein
MEKLPASAVLGLTAVPPAVNAAPDRDGRRHVANLRLAAKRRAGARALVGLLILIASAAAVALVHPALMAPPTSDAR